MSKHNFVESEGHGSESNVVVYCTWCGLVVWSFLERTIAAELQKEAECSCPATTGEKK